MSVVHFFFGRGWWVAWYVAFYLALLVTVVLTLAIFAQDLKRPGEKPDTPSPGSFMVVMVGAGLGFVTFANGLVFAHTLAQHWGTKVLVVIAVSTAVALALFPLNILLATRQNRPAFYANVAASGLVVLGNLVMLSLARTRPSGSVPLPGWAVIAAVALPITIVIVMLVVHRRAAARPLAETHPWQSSPHP